MTYIGVRGFAALLTAATNAQHRDVAFCVAAWVADQMTRWAELQRDLADNMGSWAAQQREYADNLDRMLAPFSPHP